VPYRKPDPALPKLGARLALTRRGAAQGIPLNWIYEGKMTNLPPHIRAKIQELQREPVKR
jgi:hypothetical protein